MSSPTCKTVTPECPVSLTTYGYAPSLPANLFFAIAFALLLLANLVLVLLHRTYTYSLFLSLACLAATLGYAGRIMMHYNAWDYTGFIIQICCLILSPAFNSAAMYLTLKHVTLQFGRAYSRIRPEAYTYVFIACDLISMILQAIGGGLAATAENGTQDGYDQLEVGDKLMNAGVAWQVACLLVFSVTVVDYVVRRTRAVKSGEAPLTGEMQRLVGSLRFRLFAVGVVIAVVFVLLRCVYRIAEMAGGFGNEIMRNEPLFIALEGGLILGATLAQTVFHPGYCFPVMGGKAVMTSVKGIDTPASEHELAAN